jgi:hypothetical protein
MAAMTDHAEGAFTLDTWDARTPYDEREGTVLTPVHVTKTFTGGLTGTSTAELITVTNTAGPLAYVGIERFEGTLDGRKGGFMLQHTAGGRAGEQWLSWQITEGTGTGDLTGITGEGQIIIGPDGGHSYTLDYSPG